MQPIAEQVVQALARRGLRLAVAEADTGGLIGSLITDVPGSSRVFPGGVIAYANAPKRDPLGVSAALLAEHGAVSAEVAAAMAAGVCRLFGTEVGVAATGITGPTGGTAEKPIGTVFIACAAPSGATVERRRWEGDRERCKEQSALAALMLVLRAVDGD